MSTSKLVSLFLVAAALGACVGVSFGLVAAVVHDRMFGGR